MILPPCLAANLVDIEIGDVVFHPVVGGKSVMPPPWVVWQMSTRSHTDSGAMQSLAGHRITSRSRSEGFVYVRSLATRAVSVSRAVFGRLRRYSVSVWR